MPLKKLAWILGLVLSDQVLGVLLTHYFPGLVNLSQLHWLPGLSFPVLTVCSGLILACLLGLYYPVKSIHPGLILIASGWLSNLLTHWRYGAYLDYLPLHLWYSNLADSLIILGLLLIFLKQVLGSTKKPASAG